MRHKDRVNKSKWKKKIPAFLFLLITTIGIFLRTYQYLMGRSLWEDEAHLALNFMSRDFSQLLEPLDFIQMAPVLFLMITKAITTVFGYNELAFRFLPFILSILTLPLFYFIVFELTKKRSISLMAFAIFSINITPCYFAAELKPYALDLAVFLTMVFLAVTSHKNIAPNRTKWLLIAGSISLFLSYISVVVLACIGAYEVYQWFLNKKFNTSYIKVFLFWGIAFLINYTFFISNNGNRGNQVIQGFWSTAFMPLNVFSIDFIQFIKTQYNEVFFELLVNLPKTWGLKYILPFILLLAGVTIVLRRNYKLLFFALLPIIIHLLLSAFNIYPFYYRLILYLLPAFILFFAYGVGVIVSFIGSKIHYSVSYSAVLVLTAFFITSSIQQFPLWYREIGPSIHFINENYAGANVYITTPLNTYTYYDKVGKVKEKNYTSISWNLSPERFENKVINEKEPFLLLVNDYNFKPVINHLENKNRVIDKFEYKDYGVWVISPDISTNRIIKIDDSNFDDSKSFELDNEKVLAIWSGSIKSSPLQLNKGKYKMTLQSKGTPAFEEFPKINIFIDEDKVGSFTNEKDFKKHEYIVHINDYNPVLRFEMINDAIDKETEEDRNSFISSILLERISD